MTKLAHQNARKPKWPDEASFVAAVIARAREEIAGAVRWPTWWKEAFLSPSAGEWFRDDTKELRELGSAAKTAIGRFADALQAGDHDDPMRRMNLEILRTALLAVASETPEPPGDRRTQIVRTMRYAAKLVGLRLTDHELALMSICAGWANETHMGWQKSDVRDAIEAEANTINRTRARNFGSPMARALSKVMIDKALELGAAPHVSSKTKRGVVARAALPAESERAARSPANDSRSDAQANGLRRRRARGHVARSR